MILTPISRSCIQVSLGPNMPIEHFKSAESYRKYRAYTHIHGIPTHAKNVVVAGKKHKVKHGSKKKGGK